MNDEPSILLTNDDGIDSVGFRALYDALTEVGSVTAVAPNSDQSAVGRAISHEVPVHQHELGYAVEGTPTDCVVAGIESLVPETDLVVAGCNRGANLGAYVLGRSGTVSAAVEATFFDVPAIAVSMYIPVREDAAFADVEENYDSYAEATRAASYLAAHSMGAGVFEQCDYLNVNAPVADRGPAEMAITEPSRVYQMGAERNGETVTLHDRIWERMAEGDIPDPEGTDRRAVVDGKVSVSPLTAPHTTEHHEALDGLAETYDRS
ncbi:MULTISPECIES: 5'/3'-nucleotidase SurE [Halomicrobium]|uniref:5'-nucleotidase SurE n=2 Tax=Halomicrobium mukohataei TaxID=57705 RepID=C7NY07_HALMD|nr:MULTISPECIES: 5'/3'-nucleotidase SurE [Halomicrobium]ACV48467.1 stationary-phase survival protein SurE [Halomicrobium mukohataei DSM 12286]QCD66870.1 5'/3'-nucleotidase SurE [Halomicrobium mukohataei]QFR21680.1 5'/3'-nucleotidase SurE [Halomicrobium sp. ZPS1]